MINVFQPTLGNEELAAVSEVFNSNWIGRGRITESFEHEFAMHLGTATSCVTSVVNCTEGLFHVCANLGLNPGDEIILPTISFVGAANAVAAIGCTPVFCGVDPRTLNARVEDIEAVISSRSKAILIIHYGGVPGNLDDIKELARVNNLYLIEDCACSVGSRYRGQACGTFGDAGVWSFDAMKILVSGDGGMIWCHDEELLQRLKKSIYLGLDSQSGFTSNANARWWEFSISQFGRRATMNDIGSAIGRVQLVRLPAFLQRRRQIWDIYQRELNDLDWLFVPDEIPSYIDSSYYLYWIQLSPDLRDRLAQYLKQNGVYTTFRYYPLHRIPYYNSQALLPFSDKVADSTLNLPLHQGLSDEEVFKVIELIKRFI